MNRNDQNTVPSRTYNANAYQRPAPHAPQPAPRYAPQSAPQPDMRLPRPPDPSLLKGQRKNDRKRQSTGALFFLLAFAVVMLSSAMALGGGLLVVYSSGILPHVRVNGVALGGLSTDEATQLLQDQGRILTLRDGDRTWQVAAGTLGLSVDAAASAEAAYDVGRGDGSGLTALFSTVDVAPVIAFDPVALRDELERLADQFAIAPINAGVNFSNGRVEATPAQFGSRLDAQATTLALLNDPGAALLNGEINLVMQPVTPEITDASALVARAEALLRNPLDIRLYDAVTGNSIYWTLPPDQWASWLQATPDANSNIGLALTMQAAPLSNYLTQQATTLGAARSIDVDAAVQAVQTRIAANQTSGAWVEIAHLPRTHTVQAGETITSIAWDYGIPYLYIQQANDGIEYINAGQSISIPPADTFLLYPTVPDKRIVVDISEQRTRVYENGQIKWDWLSSTGISDSPTWPGIYQVISRVPNAYAANWNLYMPDFIGVYQPVPNADFTNGFHGFPTRGGGQLLWQNSLGRRVTYGCILLDDTNARLLYNWVEEGVVVEIRP